jgi:hypothetical protein
LRIHIKEQGKTKIALRLPSGPLMMRLIMRFIPKGELNLSKNQKQKLLKELIRLRKIHRPLFSVDIQAKDGTTILVKF